MRKKILLFTACLTLLAGSSSVWGQHGVLLPENQEQITPRRGDAPGIDYVKDDTNVNNPVNGEFGAGESVTITAGALSWPVSGTLSSSTIQIGSQGSQNIVINSYNGNGFISGWADVTAVGLSGSIYDGHTASGNMWANGMTWSGTINGYNLDALTGITTSTTTTTTYEYEKTAYVTCFTNTHNTAAGNLCVNFDAYEGVVPYTSTRDFVSADEDDGTPLIQVTGSTIYSSALLSAATPPLDESTGLIPYIRPTTVAVGGINNEFTGINFLDLQWWYSTFTAVNDPNVTGSAGSLWTPCAHIESIYGSMAGVKYDVATQLYTGIYLDAAVQLLDGAQVCVTGSIVDGTGTPASMDGSDGSDAVSDALLVVPEDARFTLRTYGNVEYINMQQWDGSSGNSWFSKTEANVFPDGASDIFLLTGGTPSSHAYATPLLTGVYNPVYEMINTPPSSAIGAIFGVRGNYVHDGSSSGNNADIHTGGVGKSLSLSGNSVPTNNPGVIEIGSATTGADRFHIYSGGTLKNFESCNGPASNFALNLTGPTTTPNFIIDGSDPLYILNYGNNGINICAADINFGSDAAANLESALASASGTGALHIQARSDVQFQTAFAPAVTSSQNHIRILSDQATVSFLNTFDYSNDQSAHLTIWAKGITQCLSSTCGGSVLFGGDASFLYDASGNMFVRSDNDDVIFQAKATYKNTAAAAGNGETVIQAGRNINVTGALEYTHMGEENILLEAKHSIRTQADVAFKRAGASAGDITMKAGYQTFNPAGSADPSTLNWASGLCSDNNYTHRTAPCTNSSNIWFDGTGTVTFTIPTANDFNTTMRAFNSIYVDPAFAYTNSAANTDDTHLLMFAETGNIEAIKNSGTAMTINMTEATNHTIIRLQAGNTVGMNTVNDMNVATERYPSIEDAGPKCTVNFNEWDGNILFNKPFSINHDALGQTLISAERDIENQINGPMTFSYTNTALENPFLMTAGRHIETHSDVKFDYATAGVSSKANITMQAGRLDHITSKSADNLCKVHEFGSTLTEANGVAPYDPANVSHQDNDFSIGGAGNGSILLFAPLDFIYKGQGDILMTALNGDIESDPYLHGDYKGAAAINIDHNGSSGETTLEAIDIRLHDVFRYDATTGAATSDNGTLNFFAFDSILTRAFTYTNLTNSGDVNIIADKYKGTGQNGCYTSITQGHIVLGYGADADNLHDTILFDFGGSGNASASGANLYIKAGYEGFAKHPDKKSEYGGNITYDHMIVNAAMGNRKVAGYTEISTPNGNIWGKDSITYSAWKGNLLVDAGMGSIEDEDAIAWKNDDGRGINQNILNTSIPTVCKEESIWRTGNIMMKGGSLNFNNENGNATFRTREGYIDTYDAFNVFNMKGELLKYAHAENTTTAANNQYGDISERDFTYIPAGGSVYYGADDNIMFNYGNSNGTQIYTNQTACSVSGNYAYSNVRTGMNPYYNTSYKGNIGDAAVFNVNTNGYLFYKNMVPVRNYHFLYRGGNNDCTTNSGLTGVCATSPNGARDITMDFSQPNAGGFATVANNYVDFFTKFTYMGGSGSGMPNPTTGNLLYESVSGYGLYLKSRNEGVQPEARRVTCFNCKSEEWPAVTFHDNARIHMEGQKVLLEAPVVDFFGHAELDATSNATNNSRFMVKADSLIFHDSAIFDGTRLQLLPYTTADRGMRHGIMNDLNYNMYKAAYGPAIVMEDRELPVLEFGYQRCNEPFSTPNVSKNNKDVAYVGGDVIIAVKHGYELPILNTVVANHARISFIDDMIDGPGNVYYDANVRTDLLRIRNKVEFYTDPSAPTFRKGTLRMTSDDQMLTQRDAGIYPRHLHMEPGSELSIPGEDSLTVIATTTVGGYGDIHENITVKANGTIAPGYASFMEHDCTSGSKQGKLTIHNLHMEKDAEFRVSIGGKNCQVNPSTGSIDYNCTQMDTLHVKDTIHFEGKIPLYVLTEDKTIAPGCYLFMIYDDIDGASKERVKNLELEIDRYEDAYFYLNFTTPGEVWLCVSNSPNPELLQYIDLPHVEGVTTNPSVGKHYVASQKHFTFTARYTGAPYKVTAVGYYSGKNIELLGEKQEDGSYKYILTYVVEPWTLAIGPAYATDFVDNEVIDGEKAKVWAHNNTLYIDVAKEDIVSIYSMTGVLHRRMEISEGSNRMTLERGMYVVTLKDGSVHKVVIR